MLSRILVLLCILRLANAAPFWKVFCDRQPIYRGRADPIVTPGSFSGHSHRVFGANNFDLGNASYTPLEEYNHMVNSTCTTCSNAIDKTAYWIPDLYYQWPDGAFSLVPDAGLTVYYPSRAGSGNQSNPNWTAFPPGLRMLAGTPTRRTFNESELSDTAVSFACLGTTPSPETPAFPADISLCINGLRAQIWFPMCWDGVNLDSIDHKQHMSYPIEAVNSGNCPSSHPVRVPGVFFEVLFSITSFPKQNYNPYRWSCGDPTGYGFHGDFLNGWDQKILQAAINDPTCDANNTNNGNDVAACATFAPHLISMDNCTLQNPIPMVEDLGYTHPILELPGCNPITTANSLGGTCNSVGEPYFGPDWRRFLLQQKTSTFYVGAKDEYTFLSSSVTVPSYPEIWTMKSAGTGIYSIQSDFTGQYLTSPRGDPLICNRGSPSTWETFVISPTNASIGNYYTILSLSNNQYVSLGEDGLLRGDSDSVGDLQLWRLVDPGTLMTEGSATGSPYSANPANNGNTPTSADTAFPLWVIGVVIGVLVIIIVVVAVVIAKKRRGDTV